MESRLSVHQLDTQDINVLLQLVESLLERRMMTAGQPHIKPLENVLNHAHQLGAACAIIQKNVQDPDFLAEHSAYYSKWSAKVSRYCTRIHFFTEQPLSDDPLETVDQMVAHADSYLGFTTLRPIRVSPVAATFLKPRAGQITHFITSGDKFRVNLAGQTFYVHSTPYLQQDNAVGACAQASIWMALRTLRQKDGQSAFSPAQITTAATRFIVSSRTLPNRSGLSPEQISEAVRAAGYSPHLIPLKQHKEVLPEEKVRICRTKLYPYVESGIPVLLGLEPEPNQGHAIVLVGHGWTQPPNGIAPKAFMTQRDRSNNIINFYDASEWARPFLVHNDNTGPYMQLDETQGPSYLLNHASLAIPFLPPDVFISGEEARAVSLQLLVSHVFEQSPPDLVFRTYLQSRADFRQSILNSAMSHDTKKYYRLKWLPRRVWVTEINSLHQYGQSPTGGATRLGEVVLDPASEPIDGNFLTIHLTDQLQQQAIGSQAELGVIINRDAFNGEITADTTYSDPPYTPLVR